MSDASGGSRDVHLRRFDPRDATAVQRLHRVALREAGTDPAAVPGADDLTRVEAAYLDAGGEFLVGVRQVTGDAGDGGDENAPTDDAASDPRDAGSFLTHDGHLVAMGGYLPVDGDEGDAGDPPPTAELHRMRVAPAHQRAGHGRRLLRALERRARAAGFERMSATTAARQRAAVAFYPAAGYVETGRSAAGAYELVHFECDL